MQNKKLSVIVPIHNGQKYIKKLTTHVLGQTYKNLELIFIENGSSDQSWEELQKIKSLYPQVLIFQSECKGTSQARAMGIRKASSDYIIFADQDDHYESEKSLENMMSFVLEDTPDIAQFGYYTQLGVLKKKKVFTEKKRILTRKELLDKEIAPIVASYSGCLSPNVWTKIYKTDVLKSIVDEITESLYYCEDMYLNTLAFFSPRAQKIVVYPEAFYMWQLGIGTSGSETAGDHLFYEYNILKPLMFQLAEKNHASDHIKYLIEIDVLWFYGALIKGMLGKNEPKDQVLHKIIEYESLNMIKFAKQYISQACSGVEGGGYSAEQFLSSNYSPEELYQYWKEHFHLTKKEKAYNKALSFLKKAARIFNA